MYKITAMLLNKARAVMAGATLASFVLAAVFFLLELLVFKTLGWKTAMQPLVVAGTRKLLSNPADLRSYTLCRAGSKLDCQAHLPDPK